MKSGDWNSLCEMTTTALMSYSICSNLYVAQ